MASWWVLRVRKLWDEILLKCTYWSNKTLADLAIKIEGGLWLAEWLAKVFKHAEHPPLAASLSC